MKRILYVPGINENTETGLVKYLYNIPDSKVSIFAPWKSIEDLEELTLRELQEFLLREMKNIKEGEIILAGRSFGAGVILTLNESFSSRRILFAPAICFSEEDNFNLDTKFKHIKKFFLNNISRKTIESYNGKILIFHDSDDESITFSNSVKMAESKNVKLFKSKSGHSFKEDKEVIEDIKKWLEL